jgi:hypothetical protein
MFSELLKPHLAAVGHDCAVEEVHSTGQKERRILDVLEPVVQQHRLVVDQELIETDFRDTAEPQYRLFYQLTHLTRARGSLRHDDRIEAVAGAVAYFVRSMAIDAKKAEEKFKEKALDKALKEFIKSAKGNDVRDRHPRMRRRW